MQCWLGALGSMRGWTANERRSWEIKGDEILWWVWTDTFRGALLVYTYVTMIMNIDTRAI